MGTFGGGHPPVIPPTIENRSKIHRKSIENLSGIYRESIEHLWISLHLPQHFPESLIEHLSSIQTQFQVSPTQSTPSFDPIFPHLIPIPNFSIPQASKLRNASAGIAKRNQFRNS